MDYRAACDTIMAIQRDLHFKVQEKGYSALLERDALDASYVLMEYLVKCIKGEKTWQER